MRWPTQAALTSVPTHHIVLIRVGRFEDTCHGLDSRLCREVPQSAERMPRKAPAESPFPFARNALAHVLL